MNENMLISLFYKVLEMSMQAGILILAVLVVRLLFRKLPKNITCILWGMVALRLIVPVNLESSWSLVPDVGEWIEAARIEVLWEETEEDALEMKPLGQGEELKGTINAAGAGNSGTESGVTGQLTAGQGSATQGSGTQGTAGPGAVGSGNAAQGTDESGTAIGQEVTQLFEEGQIGQQMGLQAENWIFAREETINLEIVLATIWLLGTAGILIYGAIGYLRVRYRVREAVHQKDNVWLCDRIESPFLLGYVHPRIYLPFGLEKECMQDIILHERAHIARKDYISKLAAYVLLSVYWFQPLIWVAYILFGRDVEMACDERVIRNLDTDARKNYSETLLLCSVEQKQLFKAPLAFGEVGVKTRIRNVLQYKKPGFWAIVAAVIVCLIVAACFWTSPDDGEVDKVAGQNVENVENVGSEGAQEIRPSSGRPTASEGAPTEASDFLELIAGLDPEMFYARVEVSGNVGDVLFVSEGAYPNPESGAKESFHATVYYMIEDIVYDLGEVSGSGTAYPIRYSEDGIFVAGGHYVGRYLPNPETKSLELVEYAGEVFDESGNVTYWYYENGEERIVEDSSYLDALIRHYGEAESVAFKEGDLTNNTVTELVPQVTIDPMTTITALPMGTVAEVDLDGDGVQEAVQVKALEERQDGKLYLFDNELPSIQIGKTFFTSEVLSELGGYGQNIDIATYYIFDLDLTDSFKEIGVYFDGPSGDPETLLFRYKDGYLSKVGTFSSEVISDVRPPYAVMWEKWHLEPEEYQEILDNTKRDEILITVPGDGMVYATSRYDMIETAWATCSWKLDEISGKLIEVEQEEYIFKQYEREHFVTLKQEIEVYNRILLGGDAITLPKGTEIVFERYRPQDGWMEIRYRKEEAAGSGDLESSWEEGWFQVIDGEIVTPSGKYDSYDLFENLNMAG